MDTFFKCKVLKQRGSEGDKKKGSYYKMIQITDLEVQNLLECISISLGVVVTIESYTHVAVILYTSTSCGPR